MTFSRNVNMSQAVILDNWKDFQKVQTKIDHFINNLLDSIFFLETSSTWVYVTSVDSYHIIK